MERRRSTEQARCVRVAVAGRVAAALCAGAAVGLAFGQSSAQMRQQAMTNAQRAMMGMGAGRPGMGAAAALAALGPLGPQPTTPLGRRIASLDFSRTPEGVLRARSRLAAEARGVGAVESAPGAGVGEGGDEMEGEIFVGGGAMAPTAQDAAAMAAAMQQAMAMAKAAGGAVVIEAIEGDGEGAPAGEDGAGAQDPPAPAAGPSPDELAAQAAELERAAKRLHGLALAGDWRAVGDFLRNEAGADGPAIYGVLLGALCRSDTASLPGDVLGVAEAAPGELSDVQVSALGLMLGAVVERGADATALVARIAQGAGPFGPGDEARRARSARLLAGAGLAVEAGPYLPALEQALAQGDAEAINLHALLSERLSGKSEGVAARAALRRAFDLSCAALAATGARGKARAEALGRAIALAPKIDREAGEAWLRSLFVETPELGWAALAASAAKPGELRMMQAPPEARAKALAAQRRLADALLDATGGERKEWRAGLDMLAMALLPEADDTIHKRRSDRTTYIEAAALVDALPDVRWLGAMEPGLASKMYGVVAGVAGRAGRVETALDVLRAPLDIAPERLNKLGEELVVAWAEFAKPSINMNDPWQQQAYMMRQYQASYGHYGYGGGAREAIPLTLSRQRRNLEQLGGLLESLASLGVERAGPEALVKAFSAGHSDAEVFEREWIERIFGPIDGMAPELAAGLGAAMRTSLATSWRSPRVQQEARTKRTNAQIAAEAMRGYALANELAAAARAGEPEEWSHATLAASLAFDEAELLYGQKADLAVYGGLRERAFDGYEEAVGLYVRALERGAALPTAAAFIRWFSSALGASDLGHLTRQDEPDDDQITRIIAALDALPAEALREHVGLFAKAVDEAAATLAPELKPRYVRHAMRIVGDHPDGQKSRELLALYDDLVREVRLDLRVDGSTQVGHGAPFGARLALRSTRALSRESARFAQFLRNGVWTNTGGQVDHRDELEAKIREALGESFEVVAIQFYEPDAPMVAFGAAGWEERRLAYLLLKARDAAIDRLPPVSVDLDFSDGVGQVLLPVESAPALIDARTADAAGPGATEIKIEQTLDARERASGVLRLDVRATARGLAPELERLVDGLPPAGFEIARVQDHGVNIVELDNTADDLRPLTERSWLIELRPVSGAFPAAFAFPAAREGVEPTGLRRFADADIVDAAAIVEFDRNGVRPTWIPLGAAGALIGAGAAAALVARRRRAAKAPAPAARFTTPERVTAMSALALLRRIEVDEQAPLDAGARAELTATIEALERRYFAPAGDGGEAPSTNGESSNGDLTSVVGAWVRRACG